MGKRHDNRVTRRKYSGATKVRGNGKASLHVIIAADVAKALRETAKENGIGISEAAREVLRLSLAPGWTRVPKDYWERICVRLREAKEIPAYNEELMRSFVNDCRQLYSDLVALHLIVLPPPEQSELSDMDPVGYPRAGVKCRYDP